MTEEYPPEAREYLAALARGDEAAEQLQDLHEKATQNASNLLKLAAEHYAAVRIADFWAAEPIIRKMSQIAMLTLRAHSAPPSGRSRNDYPR